MSEQFIDISNHFRASLVWWLDVSRSLRDARERGYAMASDGKKGPLAGGPKKGVKEGTRAIKSKKGFAASTKVTGKGKKK